MARPGPGPSTSEAMNISPLTSTPLRAALALLDILVLCICIGGFYQVQQKPSIGAVVSNRGNDIVIERITRAVPDLIRAARIHDTIATVDGLHASNLPAFETIVDGRRIGDVVRLTLKRGTGSFDVDVTLVPQYTPLYLLIIVVISGLFLVLGVLVLAKKPEEPHALTFHMAMNAVAVMLMATAGSHIIEPYGLGHAVRVGDHIAYAFMTVIFFHFTLQFPTPKWYAVRQSIGWLYAAAALIVIVTSTLFLLATLIDPRWINWYGVSFGLCQKFFGILGVASVGSFVHSYVQAVEEAERNKLRWVLTGVTVGFLSFIVLQLIPQFFGQPPLLREEWIVLFAGVAPVTFAIAIVRHRVMNIDLLLSRSTAYTVVLGVLALTYTGLVYSLGALAQALTGTSDRETGPILATLAVALMFEPARARVQHFVDRRFFRAHYNFRQAQRTLAEELNGCVESSRLIATATDILDRLLAPERIALTTMKRESAASSSPYSRIVPGEIYASERWIEPGLGVSTEAQDLLDGLGVCCAIAAPIHDDDMAMLVVGPKKSGTRYTLEDLDVLRAAITHTSSGLERIMLQTNIVRREAEAERLRELDRMRSYFVSSVTHELKTPLTSIRLFAEMLQSERTVEEERMRRYAKIIESESQRLTRLIDNVLDFSRIESGAKEYRIATVDLIDLVDGVVNALEHQIATSGFTLERFDTEEHIELAGDADAITGALVNLISNAIKYSETDRRITVRTFRRDDLAGVSVADHGIGLSEADRERIFDPFYRAEGGKSIGASGTGLGLALVRHVVEAHAGVIEVDSARGIGSTFTLLFPTTENHQSFHEQSTISHEEDPSHRG